LTKKSKSSGNDAQEQHGRSDGLGLWRQGIHLLVVGKFEAEGLLAMGKIQEVMHVFEGWRWYWSFG